MQLSSTKGEVEHFYLNSEAVRSLPVGTGLGRERREVEEEGTLTFTQTLSKNVTRILEELLMGYDQTERPPSKGKLEAFHIVKFIARSRFCINKCLKSCQTTINHKYWISGTFLSKFFRYIGVIPL